MLKFGKWINNFNWWDIVKIIISVGKEKVQFTLISYLEQNKDVQLDLQRFEIFVTFEFATWENNRRKVNIRILAMRNMRDGELPC